MNHRFYDRGAYLSALEDYDAMIPRYGQTYIGLTTERDTTPEGEERITPAGAKWQIQGHSNDLWDLVCDDTGGWIRVSKGELASEFKEQDELAPDANCDGYEEE